MMQSSLPSVQTVLRTSVLEQMSLLGPATQANSLNTLCKGAEVATVLFGLIFFLYQEIKEKTVNHLIH